MNESVTVHCWEPGPDEVDGIGTTCMLEYCHKGPHEWTRDDEINFTFEETDT